MNPIKPRFGLKRPFLIMALVAMMLLEYRVEGWPFRMWHDSRPTGVIDGNPHWEPDDPLSDPYVVRTLPGDRTYYSDGIAANFALLVAVAVGVPWLVAGFRRARERDMAAKK